MPSINRIKSYMPGAFYHVYNRGVAKQEIFTLDEDFSFFLKKMDSFRRDNVDIVTYCLMKNHFHLLLQSRKERGLESYMRSLGTSYSQYYNKKYGRVGHLFQESYKARMLKTDKDIQTVIRYIHENPYEDNPGITQPYPYSGAEKVNSDRDNPTS